MLLTILSALALQAGSAFECPAEAACAEAESILVVAPDPETARTNLELAIEARADFEQIFGPVGGSTAIVTDAYLYPAVQQDVTERGYDYQPWLSPDGIRVTLETQVAPALRAAMSGLSEEEIDARISTMIRQRLSANTRIRFQEAIFRHELGHLWFRMSRPWPPAPEDEKTYGAHDAPDWLDEAAAVAMETGEMTGLRRAQFCQALPGVPHLREDFLENYLASDHPLLVQGNAVLASVQQQAVSRGQPLQGRGVMVMTSDQVRDLTGQGIDAESYYEFTRGLLDYIAARSGDLGVLGEIADAAVSGMSVEGWLETEGARFGLPGARDALIADWAEWSAQYCGL